MTKNNIIIKKLLFKLKNNLKLVISIFLKSTFIIFSLFDITFTEGGDSIPPHDEVSEKESFENEVHFWASLFLATLFLLAFSRFCIEFFFDIFEGPEDKNLDPEQMEKLAKSWQETQTSFQKNDNNSPGSEIKVNPRSK